MTESSSRQPLETSKVGILPYYYNDRGEMTFIVTKPHQTLPEPPLFVLPRGTPKYLKDGKWIDLPEEMTIEGARRSGWKVETPKQTALREMAEEAGLMPVGQLFDCGVHPYNNYGIHFFSAKVRPFPSLQDAKDAQAVKPLTLAQARSSNSEFKPSYVPLLEALADIIKTGTSLGAKR